MRHDVDVHHGAGHADEADFPVRRHVEEGRLPEDLEDARRHATRYDEIDILSDSCGPE